jgi:hypothetical protein
MAILYCSSYASLAISNTSKGYFRTVPFQDVFKKHQEGSRWFPRGYKTDLIWPQDVLRRLRTHKMLQDASKTLQDEQYPPILTIFYYFIIYWAQAKVSSGGNPSGARLAMPTTILGMKIRILHPHVLGNGLVKDAEGEVANIVLDPLDQQEVDADIASEADTIYLRHLPLGVWVRMRKYTRAPFCKALRQLDDSLLPIDTQSLVWMEPRTSYPFIFRDHIVVRTGFSFTHGLVIPSTACHGRTLPAGVIIDCAHAEDSSGFRTKDDWWVEVYEMLMCATRLEDVLLMRAPPSSFLLQGPPNAGRWQFRDGSRIAAASSSSRRGF